MYKSGFFNSTLQIILDNYDFYYDPKYLSIIPEWLPNNVIQMLKFIENNKVSKVVTLSKNDIRNCFSWSVSKFSFKQTDWKNFKYNISKVNNKKVYD